MGSPRANLRLLPRARVRGEVLPVRERDLALGRGDEHESAIRLAQLAVVGVPEGIESLVVFVGAQFTTAFRAEGERLKLARALGHGPVSLAAAQAIAASANGGAAARVLRTAAQQVAERGRLDIIEGCARPAIATPGIARSVISLGCGGGVRATLDQVRAATDNLATAWVDGRRKGISDRWVEPMMIGSAVLGAILEYLGAIEIVAPGEPGRR